AGGVTALYDAANQAVLTASAASLPRRAVILLGDGAEYGGASLSSPDDAYEAARAGGVTIHTIALGFNADTAYFQQLSGLTGGAALAAPAPAALAAQWQSIAALMRQLIEVIIKSGVPGDGQTHALTVRVKIGSSQAEATGTFRSAPVTPTITVSGLAAGETVDAVTPITAEVDAQGTAAAVTFSVDGEVIARDDSPPWTIELDPLTLRSGAHELAVEAADESGTTGSAAISFEVSPLPPGVSLNLLEGQAVESPLSLTPEIKSQNGVKEVFVAVDGKTAATLSEAPYRFALDPADYSGGTHVLAVTVTDASGLSSTVEVGFSVPRAATPVWIIGLAAMILLAAALAAFVIARRIPPAPPKPTGARLEVVSGPDRGKVFAVTNERRAIGRMTSAPIHLADPTGALKLSREHARVWQSEGAAFIEDAGSRHGTFANGEQVTAPVRLADGARLKLGEVELVFHGAPVAAE
ncbi:MAG: Ig-like domain-containing protein, partial [Chloroflexota bacterium]